MSKTHIIVGYGEWAKKIASFLKKQKLFNKIIIFTRNKQFEYYPNYKKITKKELKLYFANAGSVHICSSDNSHLKLLNKFNRLNKNIIVEKPFFHNNYEFKNIKNNYNNKNIIVNYIDLFNPNFSKVRKLIKKNKNVNLNIEILYSYPLKKYQTFKNYLKSWLDHPLAIILKLFGSYSLKNKIKFINNNELYVTYFYDKVSVSIKIKNSKIKKRLLTLRNSKNEQKINFLNHSLNKSSFHNLYSYFAKKNNQNKFNLEFNKILYFEKKNILSKVRNKES